MANKYIIHGATYCGDGTASNEAASAGAVGALNSIIYFEGTPWPAPAVIAAGDVVYIRSLDAAGAAITRTITAQVTVGSASATEASKITWIIDGGSVWTGVNGSFTYLVTTVGAFTMVQGRAHNNIIAENAGKFAVLATNTNPNGGNLFDTRGGYYKNFLLDWSLALGSTGHRAVFCNSAYSVCDAFVIKAGRVNTSVIGFGNSNLGLELINPSIELLQAQSLPLITHGTNCLVKIFGGRLYGVGATTGQVISSPHTSGAVHLSGFQYPNTVLLATAVPTTFGGPGGTFIYGADKGASAAQIFTWGWFETRRDDNHPVLSAYLPNAALTRWAYKIYPVQASSTNQANVVLSKIHTGADGVLTLNVDILVADTAWLSGIDKSTAWIDGSYIRTDGVPVAFSTRDINGGALDTSSVDWSAYTYGPTSFVRRRISFTTPTDVDQDTMVMIRFVVTAKSSSAFDVIFLNPDF